jgi:poly(A) polymerase Pap1
MKKILMVVLVMLVIGISANVEAQTTTTKMAAAEAPTASNVLKWTREVLPKMELLVPKLEKIKAANPGTKPSMDAIKLLATVSQLKEINAKGTRLKSAEAKRYYDLIAATVNSFYIECKSGGNGVCCVDCHNHGILGVWCFANCFTIGQLPGS